MRMSKKIMKGGTSIASVKDRDCSASDWVDSARTRSALSEIRTLHPPLSNQAAP